MGGRPTYRWERRKTKLRSRGFDHSGLFYFQCLQILLAFFLLFVGLRICLMMAFNTARCMEMVTSFGSVDGVSLFGAFRTNSWLCVLFALSIIWTFRNQMKQAFNGVFQATMVLTFLVSALCFNALYVADLKKPHGTLPVEPLIASHLGDGTIVYNPYVDPYKPYEVWTLTTHAKLGRWGERQYDVHEFVWLDENRITVSARLRDDKYAHVPDEEKFDYLWNKDRKFYEYHPWPDFSLKDWASMIRTFVFDGNTYMKSFIDNQTYRDLTPEERDRFLKREACLEDNVYVIPADNPCHYYRRTDWDSVPWDIQP